MAATSSVQFSAAAHLTSRISVHCKKLLLEMLNYQWKPEGHLPALLCSDCWPPSPGLMLLPSAMEAKGREGTEQELMCTLSFCRTLGVMVVCDSQQVGRAVALI